MSSGLDGPTCRSELHLARLPSKTICAASHWEDGKTEAHKQKTDHELSSSKAGSVLSLTSWDWGWRCAIMRMVLRLTLHLPPTCHDFLAVDK